MTLGAGEMSLRAIRTEFVGPAGQVSLRQYFRGGSYVREKAGNNPATNMAQAVPLLGAGVQINMRAFRSTTRLFRYTNAANIYNSSMQAWFGDDWGVDYPKEFVNNNQCLSTAGNAWAFRADGGAGERRLVNNGNILGAGGASESAAGLHALYINSTGLKVWNNSQIFAGGGGGGHGGTGGAGGTGYYETTSQEGPTFANVGSPLSANYFWNSGGSGTNYFWNGAAQVSGLGVGVTSHAYGGYTYFRSTYSGSSTLYYILRQWQVGHYVGGAGGGGGGTGGRGYGSDGANAGGTAGAAGGNNGGNSGVGGTGGTGGTGGGWGAWGATGATGNPGAGGNAGGGAAGGGGTAGGPPGYYIYADSAWAFYVNVSALGQYFSRIS